MEVDDPQLAEERGSGKTDRIYKGKQLEAHVKVELEFSHVSLPEKSDQKADPDVRTGIAEATRKVLAEGRDSAPHLPPSLRVLEEVTNEAFRDFFKKYK